MAIISQKNGASISVEVGPRGGKTWTLINQNGEVKKSSKSPSFPEIQRAGLDPDEVFEKYAAWRNSPQGALPDVPPDASFTPFDMVDAVVKVGVFDPGDTPELASYLYDNYGAQRDEYVKAHYDTLMQQIMTQPSQEILDIAESLADHAADSLLRTIAQADLNMIGEKISEGLAAGQNARDIARTLEEVQGLDANRAASFEKFREGLNASDMTDAQIGAAEEREFQRLLRDRRETIARTEGRNAVSQGDLLSAKATGARFKVWQSQRDGVVSDECQENEDAGPIPIDEAFPGGVDTSPQHPNCRCSVAYITNEELLPTIEEASREWAAETAEAKA